MKGVRNEAVNTLWQNNAQRIYKDLLVELQQTQKIDDLLQNPHSRQTQKQLSEWAASVIDLTESHFSTFGFSMLHYQLACVLFDYLGSPAFAKYQQQVRLPTVFGVLTASLCFENN